MIQVYSPENTDYTKNGDIILTPEEATIDVELNGAWTATIIHPIDKEGRWKSIVEEAVVKMPSFNGEQLFRIKSKEKSDRAVNALLEPIFFDSMNDCFLVDVRPTNKTGQQALDIMTASNNKYKGYSDIATKSTAYYQFKNLMEAINSDEENSFINRWGGEILFNNFDVTINSHIGGDYGVELRYGKNIPINGLSEETDIRSVVTRIYPKAYNGRTITNNGYVDSPIINNYPTVKVGVIEFQDVRMAEDVQDTQDLEGIIVCKNQTELDAVLRQKCGEQFENGIDKPRVTITADMILLKDTQEYEDYKTLEEVGLGDTIHCRNNYLDIITDLRVIRLVYNAILKKVENVVLGDTEYNYFNQVSSVVARTEQAIRPDGTVIGQQIAGFIDGALAQLRLQNTIAKKQDVRAIIFEDLDPSSETFGAMALGTQGLQISRNRTADGRDWLWTTALTAKGLIANIIVAGLIADKTGKSFWDLDTGEFVLEDGTITGGKFITTDKDNNWGTQISGGVFDSTGEMGIDEKTYKTKLRIISGGINGTLEDEKGNYFGGFRLDGIGGDVTTGNCQAFLTVIPDTVSISLNNSKYGHIGLSIDDVHKEPRIEIGDVEVLPIQRGRFSTSVPAQSYVDYTITFPVAFKGVPTVIPAFSSTSTAHSFGRATLSAHSITKSSCKIRVFNNDTTGRQPDVLWIATGK